ncbi:hypothetical protein K458DRAFT_361767 [Lentithecium fluviatile CBS 122367]|uniref:Cyclin-like domain-containing protein n=1 Tax=Lentithecium fluviatile CBS 122367 TaxID=1168545 RepID=A0A6G1JAG7_9PLEO|nr:hypothetical protein K458DRAFT_361767 [Lentithecium fluviatile CBS 122367]
MAGPLNTGRRPGPERTRLTSINHPPSKNTYQAKRTTTTTVTPTTPTASSTASASATATAPPPVPPPRKKCCDEPNVSQDEEGAVCYTCGRVFDNSNIVAEITFGENAAGAAVVQGGFVGENQRYANTMGANVRGINSIESRQHTERRGQDEISQLGQALNLPDAIRANAMSWYRLALNHNFVQGRRVRNVAAVALYLAARKQAENTLMLMDLAEKVMCSVWNLGDTYKQFCKTIMETDPAQLAGNRTVQEIEPLMLKFCRKLEFGENSHTVANDACRLLKRMKRDWMVQGRNPAGLCGACIILAARMNNFRRTVREVVYVVKVADTTINSRLYEYRRTPSSALTVDQFRTYGPQLKVKTQPPAIYKRAEKEQRAEERKRKAAEALEAEAEEGEDGDQADGSSSQAGPSRKKHRPTRTKKKQKEKARAIEHEITETIQDWEGTFQEFEKNENHEVLVRAADRARKLAQIHKPDANVSTESDIGDDEFEDDPEIASVLLNERESKFRERLWVTNNEDWLRMQQQKMLAKALEEAQGKPPKVKHKRKVNRMGDGSVLEGETNLTAAQAAHKMVAKRAKHFSNAIDYERLKELFPEGATPQGSGTGDSPAASVGQQKPAPVAALATAVVEEAVDEDAEGDYEEEEQYPEEEDEDLETQYMDDLDEGFDESFLDDNY